MNRRRSPLLQYAGRLTALLLFTVATDTVAQTSDVSAQTPSSIEEAPPSRIPALGDLTIISHGVASSSSDRHLWAIIDASSQQCADHFTDLHRAERASADGWRVSGYAATTRDSQRLWVYGIMSPNDRLYQLTASERDGQCYLQLALDPLTIRADNYRWPWPPLVVLPGSDAAGQHIPVNPVAN